MDQLAKDGFFMMCDLNCLELLFSFFQWNLVTIQKKENIDGNITLEFYALHIAFRH